MGTAMRSKVWQFLPFDSRQTILHGKNVGKCSAGVTEEGTSQHNGRLFTANGEIVSIEEVTAGKIAVEELAISD